MNRRIGIMLQSREIEESPALDEEVVIVWEKAVETYRASTMHGLSGDPALSLVYQAALQAATSVVRAAGYRVRGAGHHHHTFAAVAALNVDDLSRAARSLDEARQTRHEAVYGWRVRTTDNDLVAVRSATGRLIQAAHKWITEQRPHLAPTLARP